MTPPKAKYQIDFDAARLGSRPNDRVRKEWEASSEEEAAEIVLMVRRWPEHHELIRVWRCVGGTPDNLRWERVDPDTLRASPAALARDRNLRRYWPDNPEWTRISKGANE